MLKRNTVATYRLGNTQKRKTIDNEFCEVLKTH